MARWSSRYRWSAGRSKASSRVNSPRAYRISKTSPPGGSATTPERMTDSPNADSPYADAFRVAPSTSDALDGLNMPLQDAMLTQRAVRRVYSEPVDDAVVLKCIELALRAPTGANGQNWEFIVVKDRRVIKKLAGRYRKGWKFSYGGLLSNG